MIKVAVTGSIASGKSLAEKVFQQEGAAALDTDQVVHELLTEDNTVIKKVYELFMPMGVDVRDKSGSIDRKKVGDIVFSDKQKLKKLEKIIHPEVKKITKKFFLSNQDKDLAVVSAPLLFEAGMENMFDYIVAITANEELRQERLMKTRNLTEDQALNRIKSQEFGWKKLEKADFIIENNGSVEEFRMKVKNVINKIKSRVL